MNKYFDFSRFWLLLKTEMLKGRRAILMTLTIILGIMTVGTFTEPVMDDNKIIHAENFAYGLFIGGFILSSLAFSSLSSSLKSYQYLTLPASTFEKFLSMWLLTCIGWMVVYTLAYSICAPLINLIGQLASNSVVIVPYHPLGGFIVTTLKFYFVLQGVFLVGAVHLKGYVLPKTLFVLVLYGVLCMLIFYLFLGDMVNSEVEQTLNDIDFSITTLHILWSVLEWVFWWLFAPLCWIITFLGLKEKEV
ncbi:MAG TPA: hypothetical protein DCS93_40245 [Microscillaceae bacterium]|nr:hypothetical protein [Microscillaceae bacterium]